MTKNHITRRTFSMGAVAAASAPMLPHLARAQAYPSRPIRFVLAFGAGGVADITARIAADKLGEKLGQRIVVENQPGPGGIAAARSVTSAPADGHTLGLVTNGTAISVGAYNSLPFDPIKDFAPISLLGSFGLVFAANAQSPFKTVADFIKTAREQPGKLNVGTINVGGTQNLAAELFKSSAGVDFQIIPYRGTPEIVIALLRNDVQLLIDFYAPLKGALSDNQIRPIGTAGLARASYLPDVPFVAEAVPGYEVTAWNGIFAKAGTPPAIVAQINRALREVLVMPDVTSKYLELGVDAKASSPEELAAQIKTEIVKWAAVIDKAGIPKQ
jgi:tripartite-type tricarboxylate transporter receptor subunit TctC